MQTTEADNRRSEDDRRSSTERRRSVGGLFRFRALDNRADRRQEERRSNARSLFTFWRRRSSS